MPVGYPLKAKAYGPQFFLITSASSGWDGDTLTVTHTRGYKYVLAQIFNNTDELQLLDIKPISTTQLEIIFPVVPITGTWVVKVA